MAEDAVDTVVKQLKEEEGILYSQSETEHLPTSSGEVVGSQGFKRFENRKVAEGIALGLEEETASILIQQYGANIDVIFDIYQNRQTEAKKESIDPIVFAELVYALEYESAYKPVDFFIRRTGKVNWFIGRFIHQLTFSFAERALYSLILL